LIAELDLVFIRWYCPDILAAMASFSVAAEYKMYLISIALATPFLLTYLVTSFLASEAWLLRRKDRKPPLAPYWTPFLGHALAFFCDTSVVAKLTKYDSLLGVE
jgi:hypothetical protein